MTRKECLDKAKECVCGQREQDYGSPEDNFSTIAKLWSVYKDVDFTANDVAMMMGLLKIARIKSDNPTTDSFVDLAGYAACGCEIESGKKDDKKPEMKYVSYSRKKDETIPTTEKFTTDPLKFQVITKNHMYSYRSYTGKLDAVLKNLVDIIGDVVTDDGDLYTSKVLLYGDYKDHIFVVTKLQDCITGSVCAAGSLELRKISVFFIPYPFTPPCFSDKHPLYRILEDIVCYIDNYRSMEGE